MSTLWQALTYTAPQDRHSGLETYPRWVFVVLGVVSLVTVLAVLCGGL